MKNKNLIRTIVPSLVLISTLFIGCSNENGQSQASATNTDAVMLKFDLKDGAEYDQVVKIDYDIKTSAMGQEMNMDMAMSMFYSIDVKEEDTESNEVLEFVTNRVTMSMDTGMGVGNMNFDSEDTSSTQDPQSKMMGDIFNHYIGAPLVVTMDEQAGMKSMTGMEEIMKNIMESAGGMASTQFDQMFGGSVNENFQSYFAVFPDKEVKAGDTWEREVTGMVQAYPMKIKNTYQLKDRKDGKAYIDVTSILELDNENLDKEMLKEMTMGMDVEIEMSGTQEGTMTVDEATGWTETSTVNQDINLKMLMGGMEMPMEMKGTVTFSPVE